MQSPRGCCLGCELTFVESPGPVGLESDPRASDDPCLGGEALQVGEHWSQGLLHLPAVWSQGRRARLGQGSGVGREDRKGTEGLAG